MDTLRRLQIPPLRSCGAPVGMTRESCYFAEGRRLGWMELRAATLRRLQIPPLRSCEAPVGMTREGLLFCGRVATWMDGVESGYSVTTADPSTALLRSSGRDDKGRAVILRKGGDLDGVEGGYSAETADPSTTLLRSSGRDDKDELLFCGRAATWMDGVEGGYSAKTADPSTALLRSSGRDDKGRAVILRKSGDLDGRS